MVEHGPATQALCLAYLLSGDRQLKEPAQRAVRFICWAQNEEIGGWRYTPKQRADTEQSVWQMQALRTAQLAGLEVPRQTWDGMRNWLDRVAGDEVGATYSYVPGPRQSPCMSAAGLLCRQFLGWKRAYPGMKKGVELLLKQPPDSKRRHILYEYWATQVMHHQGGAAWASWNPRMRDLLIESQDRGDDRAHQKGSWSADGGAFAAQLGRLGVTALSLIMLEIYYSPDLPAAERQSGEWAAAEMQAFWDDLGHPSTLTVRHSVWALAEAPARAVPFVAERVHPVSASVTPERLAKLLANLDDRQFEARRKAAEELERLGELAEPTVRKEL
jgi:hypothetical protein